MKMVGDLAKRQMKVLPVKMGASSRTMCLEPELRDELMHRLKTIKEQGFEGISTLLMSMLGSARQEYLQAKQGWLEDEKDPALLRLAALATTDASDSLSL